MAHLCNVPGCSDQRPCWLCDEVATEQMLDEAYLDVESDVDATAATSSHVSTLRATVQVETMKILKPIEAYLSPAVDTTKLAATTAKEFVHYRSANMNRAEFMKRGWTYDKKTGDIIFGDGTRYP